MSDSLKKNVPAIVALIIVLVAAISISVYYLACGGPDEGNYYYEITEDGVNPGTKGPFPDTPPYVAPPTVPPPSAQ